MSFAQGNQDAITLSWNWATSHVVSSVSRMAVVAGKATLRAVSGPCIRVCALRVLFALKETNTLHKATTRGDVRNAKGRCRVCLSKSGPGLRLFPLGGFYAQAAIG